MKLDILSEGQTLAACESLGLARFGDGELRLAVGGSAISQKSDPALADELRDILGTYGGFVVGIPNFNTTPNRLTWDKYRATPFAGLFLQDLYGSAFVTRPDNAPWIDTPDYWERVRDLWKGKDVALVVGDTKSLTPGMLTGAKSVRVFNGPPKDAYSVVDQLEEELATWSGVVLACLGAAATVLCARLAARGVHALDLGHIGMFMRHAGAYVPTGTLISPAYIEQNRILHEDPRGFGGDGKKHAERILNYATRIGARSICDYGCGEGTLKPALERLGFRGFIGEYDPGMPGVRQNLPKPAQLLACTDVLEHIEPDRLDAVLRHQFNVAELGAFFTIATRPANKILPDGRNAHLIQESPAWWLDKLRATGWEIDEKVEKMKDGKCREVWVWAIKPKGSATARI